MTDLNARAEHVLKTDVKSRDEIKTLLRTQTFDDQYENIRKRLVKAGMREHDLIKKGRIKFDPNKNGKDFIAEGGFGSVYRCSVKGGDTKGKRLVLKSILFNLSTLSGIMNEIKCHMMMNDHPYVVSIRKVCLELFRDNRPEEVPEEYNGYIHLIMDQCDMDLTEYCAKFFDSGLSDKLDKIFYQVAQALEIVHEKRLIHRDIKPQNVLMVRSSDSEEESWIPQLADFGISTLLDDLDSDDSKKSLESKRPKSMKTVIGTDLFMAGEMLSGEYDQKVDIYALFISYYQCKTYYPEFGDKHWSTPVELPITRQMCQFLKYSSQKNFKDWEDLLMIGCHRNPMRRPDALELRRRLENENLAVVLGFLDKHGLNIKKNEWFWINVITKILLPCFIIFLVISWSIMTCPPNRKPKQIWSHPLFNGCICDCNGGICPENQDTCDCSKLDYGGPKCTDYKCAVNPCQNRGICKIKSGTVVCDCTRTDFVGPNCTDVACYDFDKDPEGIDYNGQQSFGITHGSYFGFNDGFNADCKNWNDPSITIDNNNLFFDRSPREVDDDDANNNNLTFDKSWTHNFCRNPNNDPHGPWCFLDLSTITDRDYFIYKSYPVDKIGYCKSKIENCVGLRLCDDNVGLSKFKLDPDTRYNTCRQFSRLDLDGYNITVIPEKYFYDHSQLEVLNLADNQIQELRPIIFKTLTNLKTLDLHHNKLKKLDVNLLSPLVNLRRLKLDGNKNLTFSDQNPFKNNLKLQELNMADCGFDSLDKNIFSSLTELKTLGLYRNNLSELPVELIKNNIQLEQLTIGRNKLTFLDDEVFRPLPKLKMLKLYKNEIKELPANIFKNNKELVELRINSNQLKRLPAGIFDNNTKLEYLSISFNSIAALHEKIFRPLTKLQKFKASGNQIRKLPDNLFSHFPDLIELRLKENQLTELPSQLLRENKKLKILHLYRNQITNLDKNADFFSSLTELQELHLWENQITKLPEKIFQHNTELVTLRLDSNQIAELPVGLFKNNKKLEILNISENQITSLDENLFRQLTKLQKLSLYGNQITNLPEKIFWFNTELIELGLRHNNITELPSNLLKNNIKLKSLNISGNQIRTLKDNVFSSLVSLKTLNLAHNKIKSLEKVQFGNLTNLEKVVVSQNPINYLSDDIFVGSLPVNLVM